MAWNNLSKVGVIGGGSFGTAIANILAENNLVLFYIRNPETIAKIKETGEHRKHKINNNIELTNDPAYLCENCTLIYPMVDSKSFRKMCQGFKELLGPQHIVIHGTKGLSVTPPEGFDEMEVPKLSREHIHTMTEVIRQETNVLRVGCLSGPNLSAELAMKKPAATVIASRFDEVVEMGKETMRTDTFRVYSSDDVLGVEFAGVFKNVMAIASGILDGLDLGINARSMLITRGLGEMIKMGRALGSKTTAFAGVAGIGDLIATCSSSRSRNFTVGNKLSQGGNLETIMEEMNEVVEGIRTAKTAYALAQHYNIHVPIIESIYKIIYKDLSVPEAFTYLMAHGFDVDADFLDV